MTYREADSLLQGRCRERRKLAGNTYLERCDADRIAVRLHSTDVLTFLRDGTITLNTGGWNTVTTRDRLNCHLPSPWQVGSERSTLVLYRMKPVPWQPLSTIDRNIVIKPDGKIVGGGDYEEYINGIRQADNERARIRNRARYWLRKAQGVRINRSNCVGGRRAFRASGVWCQCVTTSRWRRDLSPGVKTCGCAVEHITPSATGLTVALIMAEENVTVRLAKMRIYGFDRFLLDSNAKVLDSEAGYELIGLDFGNHWESVRALKMRCPSTGAVYVNTVPPQTPTARFGLDWMFDTEGYLDRVGQQA